jgi:cellulose synthase/poly-beta-1,6-N-acetylglucosamine synthase-like glycosyltransferase
MGVSSPGCLRDRWGRDRDQSGGVNPLALLLFWIPSALLGWVYLGYPLAAALAGVLRPFRIVERTPPARRISVGIAAHNEAAHLEERIRDVFAQEVDAEVELIVASDGSTDGTDTLLTKLSAQEPRLRPLVLPRSGKTGALNAIFHAAQSEIMVLTDAETVFSPGCLQEIIRAFRDPRVGCATGKLVWRNAGTTATIRNEGVYWRYEQAVRGLETRAGWLTAATGALLAVRRDLYRPVPKHADMDHLLPLFAREDGLHVVALPAAVAADRGIAGLREQFRSRTRTATRGIRANLAMATRLTPWRRPTACLAIWSHKLLRWATPWLLLIANLAALALALQGATAYLLVPVASIALLTLGGIGYLLRRAGRTPRWASLPLAIVVVNLAFMLGWLNLFRGHRIALWHRAEWRTQ